MTSVLLAFVPLLMSPPLTKIGIIYTQGLQEKKICNNTQNRVIGSMEPGICVKMLRNLIEQLAAKCLATTLSYFMVKIAVSKMLSQNCLDCPHISPSRKTIIVNQITIFFYFTSIRVKMLNKSFNLLQQLTR